MDFSENTFKNYYYPETDDVPSDEEGTLAFKVKKAIAKKRPNNIEDFFEKPKKKRVLKKSSTVSKFTNGGVSVIATNKEDACYAKQLIKIEIYDLDQIKNIPPTEHWKYADVRLKYYVQDEANKNLENVKDVIFNITKEIATEEGCTKYFIDNSDKSAF